MALIGDGSDDGEVLAHPAKSAAMDAAEKWAMLREKAYFIVLNGSMLRMLIMMHAVGQEVHARATECGFRGSNGAFYKKLQSIA